MESLAIQPNVYYTIEEVSQLLKVPRGSVLLLLRTGRARGVKIGRQWRVLGATLLDLPVHAEDEAAQVSDWLTVSASALREVWDNDEDAVYDHL